MEIREIGEIRGVHLYRSCPEIGLHNEVLISKPKTGQI